MRTWLLVALCGCASVFDLKTIPPPDAPPSCYSAAPFGSPCRPATAPDIGDTYLSASSPATAAGVTEALKLSGANPGLMKFDLTDLAIAPGERIAGAELDLYSTNESYGCKTGVDTCEF